MAKRLLVTTLVLGACLVGPAPSRAQEVDLVGTWTGRGDAVVLGSPEHHPAAADAPVRLSNVDFTLVIEAQDGRRFWGTGSSRHGSHPLIGVFRRDGTSFVGVYDRGRVEGTVVDENTIDVLYQEGGEDASVVSANVYTRQR